MHYPGAVATANAAALDIAANNGYAVGGMSPLGPGDTCPLGAGETMKVCAGPGDKPYQYRVKVVRRVDNMFGGILGMTRTDVSAISTAEYLKPLSMGSPSNQYGNDPESISSSEFPPASKATYPNFWANIAGGSSTKSNGDGYAAGVCVAETDGGVDDCNGSVNADYRPEGYIYTVDFTANGSANLQVFDPAFVNVGDHCESPNMAGIGTLTNVPSYPQGSGNTADIQKRYREVAGTPVADNDKGLQYCTGDVLFDSGPAPKTTYRVFKATVPGDFSSATQVCGPTSFPGTNAGLKNMLQNGKTEAGASAPLATYFRQWVDICPGAVSGSAGDEYFIQVQTDSASKGHNRYALRGVSGGSSPAPVNIVGNAYMGMYANVGANTPTTFDLVRVPTAAAGHTLVLNLYDIGDAAAGSTGTLEIKPPAETGGAFSGCQWTGQEPGTGAKGDSFAGQRGHWGDLAPLAGGGCTITGVNDVHKNWNAQWSQVTVPIPSSYSCNDSEPKDCWVRIQYTFTGGVQDTTSWEAYLLGDPVRLVK